MREVLICYKSGKAEYRLLNLRLMRLLEVLLVLVGAIGREVLRG